jgi:glycosyltransferase involved in cell wall biosynthesis
MSQRVLMVNNIANTAHGCIAALEMSGFTVDLVKFPQKSDQPRIWKRLLAQLFFAVKTALNSRHYDVLHIHYGYFGLLGRLSPKPYILHCHGTDLRKNLKSRLLAKPTRLAMHGASKILYATPDLKKEIPLEFQSKAQFCPNVVDTETFTPKQCVQTDGLKIFFISKLDKTKGLDGLDAILKALCERSDVEEISVLNFGNSTEQVGQIALDPKLKLLDRIPYEAMPDVIGAHDVIIGQFGLGAIGMSELEAMSCSRPLVASFKFDELYSRPMPLMNVPSIEKISETLDTLRCLKDRETLGAKSRQWVKDHHTATAIAPLLNEVFNQALREQNQ